MEAKVNQPTPRVRYGRLSFIIGIVTLSIYVLIMVLSFVSAAGVASMEIQSGESASNAKSVFALAAAAIGLIVPTAGMLANLVGLVLGIAALQRPSATDRRSWAIAGIVTNLLPYVFCFLSALAVIVIFVNSGH